MPERSHAIKTERNSSRKIQKGLDFQRTLEARISFHHSIKVRGKIAVTISLSLPVMLSVFNSHMWQNAYYRNLKSTFRDSLSCYCYDTQ